MKLSLILRRYDLFFVAVLVFLAALFSLRPDSVARDVQTRKNQPTLQHSGFEALEVAEHLSREGEFSSPFQALETGPSVHLAPAFPFVVGLIFRVFGDGPLGASVLAWLTALVFALQLALLPYLAIRLGLPPIAGLLAALVFLRGDFASPLWEVNYVGLILILLALSSLEDKGTPASNRHLWAMGILWGLLFLFSPVVIVILPFWLLWIRSYRRISNRGLTILVLIPVFMVTPWLVRNYNVFHKFVFIRGNLGLELATANNSCASYSLHSNLSDGCYAKNHPTQSLEQAKRVRTLGEVEYNHQRLQEFLTWLRHDPGRFAPLSAQRFAAFWFPWDPGQPLKTISLGLVLTWILTALSFGGLWKLWKTNRPACIYLLMWLVLFPVSYYFIVAFEPRHRIPILWATFIPGWYYALELLGGNWDSFLNPGMRKQNARSLSTEAQ